MALTLYVDRFWISPYAMSAFVALTEKGAMFETKEIGLDKKEHQQATYLAHTGRIPSLKHDDFWLAESSAIGEYVEERLSGPRIYPADMKERALCREIQAWIRSDFMPLREERATTTLWYERAKSPLSEKAKHAAERLIHGVSQLLKPGQLHLFSNWCIADTDLALMLQRLNLNGDVLPVGLKTYAENQWKRPSVRAWNNRQRPPYVAY